MKEKLINLPETGMGYHKVDIKLSDGRVIKGLIVLNCENLLTEGFEIEADKITDVNIPQTNATH